MLTRRTLLGSLLVLPLPVLAAPLPFSDTDKGVRIAAVTVWGEARGEQHRGRLAVAYVIRNRLAEARLWQARTGRPHPVYGPGTLEGICRAPWQFSVWNKSDVNYRKLPAAPAHVLFPDCVRAVVAALNGTEADLTLSANHYFDTGRIPHWARSRKPTIQINNHRFYRI